MPKGAWRTLSLSLIYITRLCTKAFIIHAARSWCPCANPLLDPACLAYSSLQRHKPSGGWSLCAVEEEASRIGLTPGRRRGPEAPAEYWENPEHIVEELQFFLTARNEEEARILAEKEANGLRKYLGMTDAEEKRIRQREAPIDRELYGELRRYGFEYLVVPIMQLGGFRTFARLMREPGQEPATRSAGAEDGGLALGRALEEKLEQLSGEVASSGGLVSSSSTGMAKNGQQPQTTTGPELDDKWVSAKPGSKAPAPRQRSWWASLVLTQPQKVYVSVLALSLALSFGRATEGAVGAGVLGEEVVDYGRLLAQATLVANALSVPALGMQLRSHANMQQGSGSSCLPEYASWMVKAALCGPLAVLQARLAATTATESWQQQQETE